MSRIAKTTFLPIAEPLQVSGVRLAMVGAIASAMIFYESHGAEISVGGSIPNHRLELDKDHPGFVETSHSRDEETVRISPFSYEVLFPEEVRTASKSASLRTPWISSPSQSARGVYRSTGYSRANLSSSDDGLPSGQLPLFVSGIASEFLRKNTVGAGYLVETDPSFKYGLPASTGIEIGQHIILAGGSFQLGEIDFPYYSSIEQSQSLIFRLYSVGTAGLPLSLLYQSNPQDLHTGIYNVTITYNGPVVPQDLIFSVSFNGVPSDAKVGLLIPNADPTIGSTPGQILSKDGGTWTQKTVAGGVKGAISISVTPGSVPEPQTVIMVFIAGIAFWAYRRNNV